MAHSWPQENHKYSYADYLTWPEGERWELIDGEPFCMSPSPTVQHQRIVVSLILQAGAFLNGKPCQLFSAPFDVCLSEPDAPDSDVWTVVQPDILVVCDPKKLNNQGCTGAPDFIIEIVSPSSVQRDLFTKMALYERYGVREYWVIHPIDKILYVYLLDAETQKFGPVNILPMQGKRAVVALPGLEMDLDKVMAEPQVTTEPEQ